MKTLAASILLAVFVSACAAAQASRSTPADRLYEAVAGNSVAVVDSASRATERRLTLGVASGDWRHLYTVFGASLIDTDPRTGGKQREMQLGPGYHLPAATASGLPGGLSPDGRLLVVESSDHRSTHMLIVSTETLAITRRVDLSGDFEFDAVDNSGTNLYLIQHLNGREYYVRLYDLNAEALTDNIVVDKSDGTQAMTGLRLSGVGSADGHWLFSMYVREDESPFIHALSLDGPFAFCLDLPGAGLDMGWSLALGAGGSKLYAVNAATGVVAEVSTGADGAPAILRTAHFDPNGSGAGATGAAVAAGKALVAGGPDGIVWIDTTSLRVTGRSLQGWRIAGLGLSPDGKTLYAISDGGRVAAISVATRVMTATFDPSAGHPMALMTVGAA